MSDGNFRINGSKAKKLFHFKFDCGGFNKKLMIEQPKLTITDWLNTDLNMFLVTKFA